MHWFYNCDILSENYDVTMCLSKLSSTKISRQQDLHKYQKSKWTNAAKILKVQNQYSCLTFQKISGVFDTKNQLLAKRCYIFLA